MSLISGLSRNYLLRKKGHRMPLAQIIQGQLIEDSTNSIARYIRLNPDMIFRIEVVENQSFNECLSQFGKR